MKVLKTTVTSILRLSAPLLFMAGCGAANEDLSDEDLSQLDESIINGTIVNGEETEGVVKLTDLGCSGTLVTNSWVLTAKHCVSGLQSVHIEHQRQRASPTRSP